MCFPWDLRILLSQIRSGGVYGLGGVWGYRRKGTCVHLADGQPFDGLIGGGEHSGKYIESTDSDSARTRKGRYKTPRSHFQTFRLELVFAVCSLGRSLPPKRNSSFFKRLAVRVALLLMLGGSVHTSSVTFCRASCCQIRQSLSRSGGCRPLACIAPARCRCPRHHRHHRDPVPSSYCSWPPSSTALLPSVFVSIVLRADSAFCATRSLCAAVFFLSFLPIMAGRQSDRRRGHQGQ